MNAKTRGHQDWFTCPQPRADAQARLFCFPFAGGGASVYHPWGAAFPATIEVHAVQLPGRENRLREPLHTKASVLAGLVADALTARLDRPFAFFGHSLGALLAFETSRELRRRGATVPTHLFVSACGAPQLPLGRPSVWQLPDAEFLAALRRLFDPPDEAWRVPELLQLLLPIMRADMAMRDTHVHVPETPLACPITAFGGRDDPETAPERLAAWGEQTSAPFAEHVFPGGHFYFLEAVPRLQAIIQRELGEVIEGAPAGSARGL